MNALEVGTRFDRRFTLVRSLGLGALAATYEAVDTVEGSTVVLKLYEKDRLRPPLEEYFRHVGTLAATLAPQARQDVIVPTTTGETEDYLYHVLPWVSASPLGSHTV